MTKTRKFMKDGELITSTTQKVVHAGDEHKMREEYHNRYAQGGVITPWGGG